MKIYFALLAIVAGVLLPLEPAQATWVNHSSGQGSAVAGVLAAPTLEPIELRDKQVLIKWAPTKLAKTDAVVERISGAHAVVVCRTTAVVCEDNPGEGSFVYRVVSRLGNWSSESTSGSISVSGSPVAQPLQPVLTLDDPAELEPVEIFPPNPNPSTRNEEQIPTEPTPIIDTDDTTTGRCDELKAEVQEPRVDGEPNSNPECSKTGLPRASVVQFNHPALGRAQLVTNLALKQEQLL